ncbi:hypothetical protein MMC21_004848 [Puttea exsequens]|nr:hypothetical protein [Puttea exsequens]
MPQIFSDGALVADHDAKPNGIAKIQFDSIEDTIEAFSTTTSPTDCQIACRLTVREVQQTNSITETGQFIIVLDSTSRENEGDLIIAAEDATADKMAFMIRHTSGLVCCPVSSTLATYLSLPQMVLNNTEIDGTAYTVSIDAAHKDMTTGISAHDRAFTCRSLASENSTESSFRRPGHVFPLRAKDKGVRERRGHTEATIEFCRLASKRPAGALCELVLDGEEVEGRPERRYGDMMRASGCLTFGRKWGIRVCTIDDLVEYVEREHMTNGNA